MSFFVKPRFVELPASFWPEKVNSAAVDERPDSKRTRQALVEGLEQVRSMLLLQLEDRFGTVPDAARERIGAAGFDDLKAWARAVLRANTLDDIFTA